MLGRTAVAACALGGRALRRRARCGRRSSLRLVANGAVLALHWVAFFAAIQVASVAIGLLGFASFPLFVLVLERVLLGRRWTGREAATALLVDRPGSRCSCPELSLANRTVQGLAWGVVSGFTFALLAVLNRRYAAHRAAPSTSRSGRTSGRAGAAAVRGGERVPLGASARARSGCCSCWASCARRSRTRCSSPRSPALSAHTASVVAALEPVYGIALAALLLGEVPGARGRRGRRADRRRGDARRTRRGADCMGWRAQRESVASRRPRTRTGADAMIVVVMGVSGCGKTIVGAALAAALGWPFLDGDDFHPPANVAKMAAGTPLTDDDRWPWLDRLAAEMAAILARGGNAVLACSALKQAYRDRLARRATAPGDVRFVYLKGDYDTIAARLAARSIATCRRRCCEPVRDARRAGGCDRRRRRVHRRRRGRARSASARPRQRCRHERTTAQVEAGDAGGPPRTRSRAISGRRQHAGLPRDDDAVPDGRRARAVARGEYERISYGLHGLPTVTDLQDAVAQIEGGHRAFAVPSGLTATTLPLLALLRAGDHVLVTDSVYGPTRRFCDHHLTRLGVEVSYYDPLAGAAIEREFRPNTRSCSPSRPDR